MITKWRALAPNGRVVRSGVFTMDLCAKSDGFLHVIGQVLVRATVRCTISHLEVDVGNRTWIEPMQDGPIDLAKDDMIDCKFDMKLMDTNQ